MSCVACPSEGGFVARTTPPTGGGGGGGGGGTIEPPSAPSALTDPVGLLAAAADAERVRLDWRLPPGDAFEAALFVGSTSDSVYVAPPIRTELTGDTLVLTGQAPGSQAHFGIGVRRSQSGSAYRPIGAVLQVWFAAPIFVDAAAPTLGADGTSAATAYPTLFAGLIDAAVRGGFQNIWVRDGEYRGGPWPVEPGVALCGGFGADFDLAGRASGAGRTVLRGDPGVPAVLEVRSGGAGTVLDGVNIDGDGQTPIGIEVDDSTIAMRQVAVRRCVDRGVRVRNGDATVIERLTLIGCQLEANGADGLSVFGAFAVRLESSRFAANAQEGVDCDDLLAPADLVASLHATRCSFAGNGTEGLDLDLAAPPFSIGVGRLEVRIDGCTFEQNALDGLLIDQEHEFEPGWYSQVEVRGCSARGNGGAGIHIDADAAGDYLVHAVRATANVGAGLLVTSESAAGFVTASQSYFAGNGGPGVLASLGNKAIFVSHCVIAGNSGGGFESQVVNGTVASSIAHVQPAPFGARVLRWATVVVDAAGDLPFVRAPFAFATVIATNGNSVTLATMPSFATSPVLELADDGVPRQLVQQIGATLELDAPLPILRLPALLTTFATDTPSVEEDLHLVPNSSPIGAGMSAVPGRAVDAGVFGGPAAIAPGTFDALSDAPLRPLRTEPALAPGIAADATLVITFSAPLDITTVTAEHVRVRRGTESQTTQLTPDGATLRIEPPAGGWFAANLPVQIELHAGLAAQANAMPAIPMVLPISPL